MRQDANHPGGRLGETEQCLPRSDANWYPKLPGVRLIVAPKDEEQLDAASTVGCFDGHPSFNRIPSTGSVPASPVGGEALKERVQAVAAIRENVAMGTDPIRFDEDVESAETVCVGGPSRQSHNEVAVVVCPELDCGRIGHPPDVRRWAGGSRLGQRPGMSPEEA